ncbi:Permease of the drug/metabolite transporter (DMT) superfamily [Modicisalibacter ilicicola DSM 19980]|uniref:Permease of the drug/metabolite transporter (DMT) superfamily n=1 Tax=Modicisalibacter ilicicola DSM 19980 TaxID=1121942 RepID=A0A1M5BSL8_9GAMM|nr:DMT family transporter [Halomonas ilicicola]SHF45529.1 Permease of the drug/metabolite transporter (DMT) superfamily [Halomonas ilicicola DSM 19980]
MQNERTTLLATLIVIGTGALWGFYWLPVRRLEELALPGAWGTLAIVTAAALFLAPLAIRRRRRLASADPLALASFALGGAAFVLYSVGLVYGRVAIVILLFFLTPVWSTLIGRYVMGWHTPRLRVVAIVVGLAGLAVMLGSDGDMPLPRGSGEWLALISGLLWSVATTGIRTKSNPGPGEAAFVFALGACAGALALAPLLDPWPDEIATDSLGKFIGWTVAAGGLWWGVSMAGLMWATARLEPARVGLLLMTEVLVGTLSAALLAGEYLGRLEILGGALVLAAGLLEVWPIKRQDGARPA